VLYVGKRRVSEKGPHSIPLVALGTGLLWFGWYGFNAGSQLRVDHITALAFLNTDVAAIGIIAGVVCYLAVELKNRLHWDDALDVWGVHGVGGALGIILLGLFGSTAINPAGADGRIHGGGAFFVKQVVAIIGSSLYAFGFTWGMLWLINKFTPVRTTEQMESTLDQSLHGEQACLA
jgi:Amt family ammonium transporter